MTPFDAILAGHGAEPVVRTAPNTVQINVGKLCNQACHHCHVDAGPKRTERMAAATARRVMALVDRSAAVDTIDITGGAPELNEQFRMLVRDARARGLRVVDRCNLTVLSEPGMQDLGDFLAEHGVEIVCSLPCYSAGNVDQQRGIGVFDKSVSALRTLNRLGYGRADGDLVLDLVYNPVADSLPPDQTTLEATYRGELGRTFGIEFRSLLTITNMPIKRFAEQLARWGRYDEYMGLLVNHFNPATLDGLMCKSLVSVSWDGRLYDCDFNQMLDLPLQRAGVALTLEDIDGFDELADIAVSTASHCFGCTAGNGSSCGGAVS